jgi:hypothetical protein
MTRIASLAAAALVAVALAAPAGADPRPPRATICDHAGIESSTTNRHVNYLNATYVGCTTGQHWARLWVHNHDCGHLACNLFEGDTPLAYCTPHRANAHTPGEYTVTCRSNHGTVQIGWKRLR